MSNKIFPRACVNDSKAMASIGPDAARLLSGNGQEDVSNFQNRDLVDMGWIDSCGIPLQTGVGRAREFKNQIAGT